MRQIICFIHVEVVDLGREKNKTHTHVTHIFQTENDLPLKARKRNNLLGLYGRRLSTLLTVFKMLEIIFEREKKTTKNFLRWSSFDRYVHTVRSTAQRTHIE